MQCKTLDVVGKLVEPKRIDVRSDERVTIARESESRVENRLRVLIRSSARAGRKQNSNTLHPRATKHAAHVCGLGGVSVIHSCDVTSDIPLGSRSSSISGRNKYRMRCVSRSVSTSAVFRS